MKKKVCVLCLALACLLVLTACGCDHEWTEAGCTAPKTCTRCGETEGEALDHSWAEATCEKAKTCTLCGEIEGESLSHSWAEADCETAKTCTLCGETEGEALGHAWNDATTEIPKTCSVCAATEGERIITDPRFITAECAPLFGSWKGQMTTTAEQNGLQDVEGEIVFDVVFTFGNDGVATQMSTFADWESTKVLFKEYISKSMYQQMSAMGMDTAAADAAMESMYGMSMEAYADAYVESIDLDAASEPIAMVYYTEGGTLYMGYSWEEDMQVNMYSIEGDKLTLIVLPSLDMIELTKIVTEE